MITIKEEFLTEEKTRLAIKNGGCEAIVMWLAIKGYVARKNSNGFVPDEAIDQMPGAPRNPRKALDALVGCQLKREDGTLGSGLVDKVEHGWKLHDYEDHGTIKEVEDERRRRAREQKSNRRAELARLAEQRVIAGQMRTMSADKTRTDADIVRGQDADMSGESPPDKSPDTPRPGADTSARACTHAGALVRGHAGVPSPAQPSREREDPPTPKKPAEDPMGKTLRGQPPATRPDVLHVHDAWKRAFDRLGAKFRGPFDEDAERIALAIDTHGESDCLLVAAYAPEDDKVSGRTDEKGERHESIRYLFENADAFSRILRAAHKRESERSRESASERIARLKGAESGAA